MKNITVQTIQDAYKHKKASPVEVIQYCLDQIEKHGSLNAFITVTAEEALAQARVAEQKMMRNVPLGKLEGIPIGLKDNIYTKNVLSTSGSKVDENFVPTENAALVNSLYHQGAISLGKQNMHEFAFGITSNNPFYGPVKNPWNNKITAAGSSGGSAAAVALGMGVGAIGTDTGGSIRIPSAACGVVGLKPTKGLLNGTGVTNISWTLDDVGPITRNVSDAAAMMDAMTLTENYTASLREDIRGMRIGVAKNYFHDDVHPAIMEVFEGSLQKLADLGAILIEVDVPCNRATLDNVFTIAMAEAAYLHREKMQEKMDAYGEDVSMTLQAGKDIPSLVYMEALHQVQAAKKAFAELYQTIDVLATPTTSVFPQEIGVNEVDINGEERDLFTETIRIGSIFNMTGQPAISVPTGEFIEDLPVGLQFVGNHFRESNVLQAAYAYEQAYVQSFYEKRENL